MKLPIFTSFIPIFTCSHSKFQPCSKLKNWKYFGYYLWLGFLSVLYTASCYYLIGCFAVVTSVFSSCCWLFCSSLFSPVALGFVGSLVGFVGCCFTDCCWIYTGFESALLHSKCTLKVENILLHLTVSNKSTHMIYFVTLFSANCLVNAHHPLAITLYLSHLSLLLIGESQERRSE